SIGRVLSFVFHRMFIQVCLYFYCKFLWRCLKFVMRKLTGRCELQRICYSTKPGASRTMKIETSLRDSKSKLWQFLKPNTPLESRISKQWCEIGFQGDDPKTDFRGMGLLGLYNLQYFAERDATAAQQVLSDSLHPKCRYSFAIVGINITDLAYNLLISGALKTHFYNIAPEAPTLSHFQQTFCYLMHEFHKFWIEEDPMDIMEFNRVREKFRKRIIKQLQNPDMALCPHFAASEGLINM
ncbi:ELMO domain-containing protein 1, partial [Fukomys damarensis]